MLWRSVAVTGVDAALSAAAGAEAVELRLDAAPLTPADVARLVRALAVPVLATCHAAAETARPLLVAALEAGADLVDLPWDDGLDADLVALAHRRGARVVGSHHDHDGTPPAAVLHRLVDGCFAAGADLAKVACRVREPREAARLIGLLDDPRPVVALGMGDDGRITRLAGAALGSPLAFVAPSAETVTAPGQLTEDRLRGLLAALGEP